MSRKKAKLYQTTEPKSSSKVIRFTIDMSNIKHRNPIVLEMQKFCKSNVVESKKKKAPKYKHKLYEAE